MPLPFAALAPVIGAGISGISSLVQNASQNRQIEKTNEFNKQFAMDMYNLNRRDALADWQRQIDYQDPKAQMERYKAAGLSPHLIYGQMQNAPSVKTPEAPKFEAQTKKGINIGDAVNNSISSYVSTRQLQADLDLAAQRLKSQALNDEYVKANTLKVLEGTDIMRAQESRTKDLFPYTLGTAINKTNLLRDQQEAQAFKNYAERQMFPKRIDLMMQQIAKIKSSITTDQIQRKYLNQQIDLMKQKNYWYGLTEGQKYETGKILQESGLWKNILQSEEINKIRIENESKKIEQKFKSLGISQTISSDIVRDLLRIVSPKK